MQVSSNKKFRASFNFISYKNIPRWLVYQKIDNDRFELHIDYSKGYTDLYEQQLNSRESFYRRLQYKI
jgi:hypothetical protein